MVPINGIDKLLDIMVRLRDPEHGCPWDRVQTFRSIAPYTIEEAYEVTDAIERDDLCALVDELGDLLFQVVFHAQLAHECGAFHFNDVVEAISNKMIRRHPHVFEGDDVSSVAEQSEKWEEMKAAERSEGREGGSLLDDVPVALPALTRAVKLSRRAARCGFDWPNSDEVVDKVVEELGELRDAVGNGDEADVEGELGDLLFTVANLARHLGVDPESATRAAGMKFERRFRELERRAASDGSSVQDRNPAELEEIWTQIKARER